MTARQPIPVHLVRRTDYAEPGYARAVAELLDALDLGASLGLKPGDRVLAKPNLVTARRGPLACSEPAQVRAACAWLLDQGYKVLVADSPAFGTAAGNARACGMAGALAPLGLKVRSLGRPEPLRLSFGADIGLSRDAREVDAILNLPRLKAHCQMRLTACAKNLFGCVSGMRKAVAHTRFGGREERFAAMLAEVMAALPPAPSLLDAVVAMSRTGPTGGDPVATGWMGACVSPVALDTAAQTAVHLTPEDLPLWAELQRRRWPGARMDDLAFPALSPEDIGPGDFRVPDSLDALRFDPLRLVKGAAGRLRELLRP